MKCDSCHNEVWGVSIYGIMPWDRKEDRKPANICSDCTDLCPCGKNGYWSDGVLTCRHGYVYSKDYHWEGDKAVLDKKFEKRRWWSYFIIPYWKHENLLIK